MDGTATGLEKVAIDAQGTAVVRATRRPSVGVRRENLAAETLRLYAADWARFAAFCAASGACALPAAAETVIAFLQAPGPGRAALTRRLAAIDYRHRQCSFRCPGDDAAVRAALKRARKAGPRRTRSPPPSVAALHARARRCRRDLAGLRDRAALLLLAIGLSRRTLVGLHADALRWGEDGLRAEGQTLWIPRGARHDLCPVRALEDWLRAAELRYGPVFRKVTRWGTVEPTALGADAVRRILARYSG